MYEHNALGYRSGLALCLTKVRSSRARCPATALIVHDGQNQLSFQRQLFTAERSSYVVNDFCSRKMKSYKSVNLISIKVPDTQIYLKTTNRGFLN